MATSAHTEVPGGGRGQFPPFNKETFASQLIWLAIIFVALYVLMSKVALPRVGGIIEARRKKIADDLVEAQRLKQESEAAVAAYEKSLNEARANAQAIAGKTRDKLMGEADARRKTLESKLGERLADAEKAIEATRKAAMSNVKGIAAETAGAIVERLTGTKPAEAAVTQAVSEVLKS
ncbi:MAG: F0F1 ATP synthase subunit B [Pseudorhodoplanes sp.]